MVADPAQLGLRLGLRRLPRMLPMFALAMGFFPTDGFKERRQCRQRSQAGEILHCNPFDAGAQARQRPVSIQISTGLSGAIQTIPVTT